MTQLTFDEVRRIWQSSDIYDVFQIVGRHGDHQQDFGTTISGVPSRIGVWDGEAGAAFHADMGKHRTDIENDVAESKRVQAAIERAEVDVSHCTFHAQEIYEDATADNWTVTPDWRVTGDTHSQEATDAQQALQKRLDQVKVDAHQADHELATAIRAAVGEIPLDEQGHEVGNGQARDVGSQERPGVTDVNDPGVKWQDGFNPNTWKNSWHNPLLADNPPNYTGGPGPERDAAWQDYLSHFPTDKRSFLPNPDAVNDPGLKVVGNAATQLGTSYAWGGKGLNGPGKGTLNDDPANPPGGAHIYRDEKRIGFDCSGLAEYAAWQTNHSDIGAGTGTQIGSPNLAPVNGPLKPGDFVYYGSGGAHHVGIYVAPGVIINAPESGLPVQVQERSTAVGRDPVDGIIRARRLP